jgi:putative membrane protein
MLLVHPIRELVKFLPVLVGLVVVGSVNDGSWYWHVLGVGVPITLGLLRYVTTAFRIADGRVELRRGLVERHVLAAPLDRVRTVDITASPVQRALGLATLRVGTGTSSTDDEDHLDLDGLPVARARLLRAGLLRAAPGADPRGEPGTSAPAPGTRIVLRLDPSWLRFAPLTSSGLVLAAAALGAATQAGNTLGLTARLDLGAAAHGVAEVSPWLAVPLGLLALATVASLLSVGGYLLTNWGFTLTHASGAWHLRRGLLTTRETSLDDDRVTGVVLTEPLGLRLAGAGRASAIVTGLGRHERGGAVLVPPAPRAVVARVARDVLGTTGPVDVSLTGHGPRARARRWTRALLPAGALVVGTVVAALATPAPGWIVLPALAGLPAAAALAADRARSLGHGLLEGHLVARSGSLVRHRRMLPTDAVVGWNFRATWFQRRAGLTSLVATTAGGDQRVTVPDVPEEVATRLAGRATPALLGQFTD